MINNAWKMNEADRNYNKGWSADNGANKNVQQAYGNRPQTNT